MGGRHYQIKSVWYNKTLRIICHWYEADIQTFLFVFFNQCFLEKSPYLHCGISITNNSFKQITTSYVIVKDSGLHITGHIKKKNKKKRVSAVACFSLYNNTTNPLNGIFSNAGLLLQFVR